MNPTLVRTVLLSSIALTVMLPISADGAWSANIVHCKPSASHVYRSSQYKKDTGYIVEAFAFSGSTIFVAIGARGVYRSTNDGEQWEKLKVGENEGDVNALVVSRGAVLAGTFDGILRSTNNGDDWTVVSNGLAGNAVWSLTVMGTAVVAGTYDGIYRSTDDGATWVAANVGLGAVTGLGHIAVDDFAIIGSNLFASTQHLGVYRSTDAGLSWTSASGVLTHHRGELTVHRGQLYATRDEFGIYRSTNLGRSWKLVSKGPSIGLFDAIASIGNTLIVASDDGVFRSTDQGRTWFESNVGLVKEYMPASFNPRNIECIGVNNKMIFLGTWVGVYRSKDNGLTWVEMNKGLVDK